MNDYIKKHVPIYRTDNLKIDKLIHNIMGVDTFAQALHYLLQEHEQLQKDKNNIAEIKKLLAEAQQPVMKKLSDMGLEQSTMSEYVSDYLFYERYHDEYVHINHGTDTDGYKNAKKVAMEKMQNNQKNATKKRQREEAQTNKFNRISESKGNSKITLNTHIPHLEDL